MSACTNQELGALLHAYELNLLAGDELDRFEAHILECRACYEELADMVEVAEALRTGSAVQAMTADVKVETQQLEIRRRRAGWFNQSSLIAAAAVLVVMAYPAWRGIQNMSQSAAENTQIATLLPVRGQTVPVISKSLSPTATLTIVYRGAESGKRYRAQLETVTGEILFVQDDFGPFDSFDSAPLLLHLASIKAGDYRVRISGSADSTENPPDYQFRVAP